MDACQVWRDDGQAETPAPAAARGGAGKLSNIPVSVARGSTPGVGDGGAGCVTACMIMYKHVGIIRGRIISDLDEIPLYWPPYFHFS